MIAVTVTWRRTWPDRPDSRHDFTAEDEGWQAGRIYRIRGGPQDKMWTWAANGVRAAPAVVGCALSGVAETKQDAADAVKAAWARWRAMPESGEVLRKFGTRREG